MKRFRLTDETGKEYWLNIPDIDGEYVSVNIEPVNPEPEIKEGMWWIFEKLVSGCMGCPSNIGLVVPKPNNPHNGLLDEDEGHYIMVDKDTYWKVDAEIKRPAAPAEIEAHLKKVCEKYIGKRVKDLVNGQERTVGNYFGYDYTEDTMSYYWHSNRTMVVRVYKSGKFADIVPDKKKKPETKEEFIQFIEDFYYSYDDSKKLGFTDFIEQYDIC